MRLSEYLTERGLSPGAFAEKHQLPVMTVRRVARGQGCHVTTAWKIHLATNGLVRFEDFVAAKKRRRAA